MPLKPLNFDGEKFAKKYNLDPFRDFYDDGKGDIICPSLPNLTNTDLLDCIIDPPRQINDDPEKALDEAIAVMENSAESPKSIAFISLSIAKYLKSKRNKLK